jgi:hypothetical protein
LAATTGASAACISGELAQSLELALLVVVVDRRSRLDLELVGDAVLLLSGDGGGLLKGALGRLATLVLGGTRRGLF